MSRSERLLQLMQLLRRYRVPVSGKTLANELGISLRTVYRDIASLQTRLMAPTSTASLVSAISCGPGSCCRR